MPACRAWPRRRGGITPSWCAASPRWRCATRRGPRRRVSCSLRPVGRAQRARLEGLTAATGLFRPDEVAIAVQLLDDALGGDEEYRFLGAFAGDRKSTRLNSSHSQISYAVFCLKKKKNYKHVVH